MWLSLSCLTGTVCSVKAHPLLSLLSQEWCLAGQPFPAGQTQVRVGWYLGLGFLLLLQYLWLK